MAITRGARQGAGQQAELALERWLRAHVLRQAPG